MSRFAYNGTFKDGNGSVITSGTINVYEAGSGTTTAANIYIASSGGTAVNSVTSDSSNGSFVFHVDEADYKANQKFKLELIKTNFITQTYDDVVIFPNVKSAFVTFTDGDATPSVQAGENFKTANTTATTVTDLDDGYDGQEVTVVIGDANTTIDFTGTNLKGNAGADWSPTTNDSMTCVYDNSSWFCDVSDNSA